MGFCRLDSKLFCGGDGLLCKYFGLVDVVVCNFECMYWCKSKPVEVSV
jgi:hypothetical protein